MTLENWINLARLIVSIIGFIAVVVTIRQKTNSDNRSEWWERYTWAMDIYLQHQSAEDIRKIAKEHVEMMTQSELATKTEQAFIYEVADDMLDKPDGNEDNGGQGNGDDDDNTNE